jgi:predicted MFS family arabinose efflux permease
MSDASQDRVIVVLLFLAIFASGTETLIINPVLPQLAASLGADVTQAAQAVTAYAISAGIFAFLFGPISGIVDRKRIIVLGLFVLGVATVWCGFATSLASLIAARAAVGAGSGILFTSAAAYVADRFSGARRGVVMGQVVSAYFLAMLPGVFIGALLASHLGWQRMFHAIGAAIFLLASVAALALPLARPDGIAPARGPFLSIAIADYSAVLRSQKAWTVVLATGLNMLGMTMYTVYLSPWMLERFHFDTLERGLAYSVGAPAAMLASPFAGRLAARYGAGRVMVAANLLMSVIMLCVSSAPVLGNVLLTAFGANAWMFVPLMALLFVSLCASATRASVLETLTVEATGPELRGSLAAVRMLFMHGGSALGAAIGGLIWASTERSMFAICVAAAGVTVAAAVVVIVLDRRVTDTKSLGQ